MLNSDHKSEQSWYKIDCKCQSFVVYTVFLETENFVTQPFKFQILQIVCLSCTKFRIFSVYQFCLTPSSKFWIIKFRLFLLMINIVSAFTSFNLLARGELRFWLSFFSDFRHRFYLCRRKLLSFLFISCRVTDP